MKKLLALAITLIAIACLGGCALEVERRPSTLSASTSAGTPVATTQPVSVKLDSGYARQIAEGTEFVEIGSIAEGRVLKPSRAVFTIEGAHMHEAYLVVRDERLVGFYLPVERSFSPLGNSVDFPTKKGRP